MHKEVLVFTFISIMLVFFLENSYAQKISDVEFVGLINVKLSEIKSKIKTKKGDFFIEENVSADIKELLSTEYFDNIEVEFDSSTKKLTFKFYERPLIKKIEVRGNTKVSTGKIKSEILLKEKQHFTTQKLDESKNKILELYDEKGYVYTTVDTQQILNEEKNTVTIIFFVNEGKKIVVDKIEVYGNKKFSQRKILRLMETKKKNVFRENKLSSDIQKIINAYKDDGFYDIQISSPVVEQINEEKVKVSIYINEGVRYKIREITFRGNSIYSDNQLLKVITIKKDKIFRQSELNSSIQSIAELYAEKGYLKLNVIPDITKEERNNTLSICFVIEENEQIYVDKIWIDGLQSTKEFVVKREVLINEGEVFNSKKLKRSLEKIYNLGFFDDVKVDIQPGSKSDAVDIVITAVEGRPGMLSAGAGYSTVDKLVGNLQVSHLNLFGRAQRLSLLWEFGERRKNYEISWTEPWFLSKPMSFGVSLYDLTRIREYSNDTNAYKEERQGLEFRLGPRLSDVFSLLFSYSYENVIIFDSRFPDDIPNGKKLTSSFGTQAAYDTRDNIFDPTRGMRHSLSLQIAGWGILSGDVKYYKPIFRSSIFIPTFWKFVLSLNTTLGYIEGIEGFNLDTVKYEKFYVGGAETVRGYGYRMLAPENGGRFMFVFNTEYKFPIVQENNRTILQGAIFYDIGGAWNELKDINFQIGTTKEWEEQGLWDNKLKHSVGFGIRFTTPVFPIRLDWAWALNPQKGRDPLQFWFTLGQMF